jgi:hypothetical protein
MDERDRMYPIPLLFSLLLHHWLRENGVKLHTNRKRGPSLTREYVEFRDLFPFFGYAKPESAFETLVSLGLRDLLTMNEGIRLRPPLRPVKGDG